MDEARRQAEIRAHAAEQRILETLVAGRPLPEVLEAVARGLEEQLDHAICSIVGERDGRLFAYATGSAPPALIESITNIDPATVNFGAEIVVVEDFGVVERPGYAEAARDAGIRSLVSIPLPMRAGRNAVLVVHRTVPGALEDHALGLATRSAGIAAVLVERADTDESLRESEQRLRQIAETLREGVWVSTVDHRPLYVSPSTARILGIPLAEIYRNGLGFMERVHPSDRPRFEAVIEAGEGLEAEFRLQRPNGEWRWLRTRVVPIHDDAGELYRFAGVVEDVTDWRTMLDRLRKSEAHYRRLVTAAPIGIYMLDPEGRFGEINPAGEEILARPASDIVGRHFAEVVLPSDLERAADSFRRLASGEVMDHTIELTIIRPSGEHRLLELTLNPADENERFVGLHGIARDVTHERQRELQLRRAERLASLGTLIGGVAHELNNPLTSIRGLSELMQSDDGRSHDDRDVLEMIRREADRMAKIVADLKRLARQTQESGRECAPVDMNDIVRHVLRVRRYTLQTSNVAVVEELTDALPPVLANPPEIEQVLLNLLVNAEQALAKHAGDERRILIRTYRADDCVALCVADNGPGIPVEAQERIFDPFYTTKAPGEGTGLGLSLVNSIVRDHGGDVRVRSQAGKGAEFTIELPIAADAPAEPAQQATRAGSGSRSVLVVEDEPTIQALIQRMLGRRGHEVTVANDGAEALRLIEADADRFDVILSDLRMPGLSGDELLRLLRERGGGVAERVVFMTGDAMSDRSSRIIEDAGVPVLMKPFTADQLVGVVENGTG